MENRISVDRNHGNAPGAAAPAAAASASYESIGRLTSISGSQAKVTLSESLAQSKQSNQATVGKFIGIVGVGAIGVGIISEVNETWGAAGDGKHARNTIAHLELIGEIHLGDGGAARFSRGLNNYPKIGDAAILLGERELRIIYGGADVDRAHVGDLQQNSDIGVHINIDQLVSRHFAVLGTTGVGKSSGVAIILKRILESRPNLRIFLLDPHNEFGNCFGDKAQVLSPRNVRLPFWFFNFEETIEAIFGGSAVTDEEREILSDAIPVAKAAYLQYRTDDRQSTKRREGRNPGFTADTPVPYRIEDLITLLDERMGKLENRTLRATYHKLLTRIQLVRNHPRYSFMFDNANLGGDTMPEVIAQLFRLPPNGKPMTIMQLAGFPAEVIDSVVSVLCRMAFDFGLWSDGAAPLLFVCEEAHRYAPADSTASFAPTRRALSRIAREGRKYGVYLGLVTQRPSEIDSTIISQCSTLFVMRLSNESDQAFIRSAVSDAAQNLLSLIPSLGAREVFTFGPGIAVPTRMRFRELPAVARPNSEAAGNTRSDAGVNMQRDLIASVVERWRSASMSHKLSNDFEKPEIETKLPPPQTPAPAPEPPPAFTDTRRQELLRRSFQGAKSPAAAAAPAAPPPPPSRQPRVG
jgi:uncharacterized protein